ncbi:MAG: DOPA 4,5-dioxygenase family protein [SAR324 cluster bacterium]|nr:DOPA 4,5-dioxygenase family protein [SAR324 cluster bacterium]
MTYESFHAHVYYDEAGRETAARVRERLDALFEVQLGRWREEPVGPHPTAMYQVAFAADQFGRVVPWLMEHHAGLSVLIHPNTDNDLLDHSERALWLGEKLALKLDFFR